MKRLIMLAIVVIVAFAGWRWWQASQPVSEATAQEPLAMPENATPSEALALTQESVDALKAENDELESRITDLQQQAEDAQQLIALKTTRLQELAEKPDAE
ncbi:MAG: hypothetical protein ABIR53_01935 [Paraperlucidibaca sp.]